MKNILIKGTIASGKTFQAKAEAVRAAKTDHDTAVAEGRIVYIPLYEGYGYSEFIEGMELFSSNGNVSFRLAHRQFVKLCEKAANDPSREYAIILDDADRTDISAVFGELLYGVEHRGEAVTLQSGYKLTVPENLTVIVTVTLHSSKDLDYALLRRFEHREYSSDRNVLEALANDKKCDPKALEEYDFYNSTIEQYLVDDLRDSIRYYLLGHGWFIGESEALVYQSMRYRVIPLLEEYVRDGILKMSFSELKIYEENAETKYNDVSKNSDTDRIVTISDGIAAATDPQIRVKHLYDEILSACNKCKGKKQLPHGTISAIFRNSFEISFENRLISHSVLMARLYLNTDAINIYNYKDLNAPVRGLLVKYDDCINDRVYHDFEYRMNKPDTGSSLYPLQNNSRKSNNRYKFKDIEYVLLAATGAGDKRGSKTYFEFSEKPYLLKTDIEGKRTGAPNIYTLLGMILYQFYHLYLGGLGELRETSDDRDDLDDLIRIVESDIAWLEHIYINRAEFDFIKDHELAQHIYTVKLTPDGAVEEGLAVFTHSLGETVTKIINGERVTAKLEGVYKMADKDYKAIMDSINIRQMILQGPPGTSKTFSAKKFLIDQLPNVSDNDDANKKELEECQLIPEMYERAKAGGFEFDKPFYWDIVQFHPSYGYEDFVRGITVMPTGAGQDKLTGEIIQTTAGKQSIIIDAPNMGVKYDTVDKILGNIAKFAIKAKEKNKAVYLIIDEINRANVSSVFGELIYALEYRNEKILTPYLVDGSSELMLPDNLYIIGTMNTADKSIGNIDYAVRRRFVFFPMLPDRNAIANHDNSAKELALFLFDETAKLFDKYLNEDYNKDDVQVGHTMFLAKNETETKNKFLYQVLPILREYYKDGVLVSNSDDNIIMDYLSNFGRSNSENEEKLLECLLKARPSAEVSQS